MIELGLGLRRYLHFRKKLLTASLKMVRWQQKLNKYVKVTELIVPDLSNQNTKKKKYTNFLVNKLRNQHAFQIRFVSKIINTLDFEPSVLDIGDSSGNHLLYLSHLCNLKSISSCDIDPVAIEKLKKKDIKYYNCRADKLFKNYNLSENIYLSFEMVEHLHNPTEFFRQISINGGDFTYFIITVPYRYQSQVGLKHIRHKNRHDRHQAADVHIFELSPDDWKRLASHAGLRAVKDEIYYQYPRHIPFISRFLKYYWSKGDFEGFYAVAFVRDNTYSKLYESWDVVSES